jgi:hypothetical protein
MHNLSASVRPTPRATFRWQLTPAAGELALRRAHNDLVASCARDKAANVRGAERIARDLNEDQLRLRLSLEQAGVLRALTAERASKPNDDLKHDTGLQSHRILEFADRRQDDLEKTRLTDALSVANEAVDARSRDVSSLESACDAAEEAVTVHARDEAGRVVAVTTALEMRVHAEATRMQVGYLVNFSIHLADF